MSGVSSREFRRVLGRFATGVTVVTTRDVTGKPKGFTANAFSSLSLDPPLVLVCLDRNSSTLSTLRLKDTAFAVNILREDQQALSRRFAGDDEPGGEGDKFSGLPHRLGLEGTPILDETVARVECVVHELLPGGDHVIVVGEVRRLEADDDGAPLLFYGGAYGGLRRARPASSGGHTADGSVSEPLENGTKSTAPHPPGSTSHGDYGTTTLLGDRRVPKDDPRVAVLGQMDEANSLLGLARSKVGDGEIRALLKDLQRLLIGIMGDLAMLADDNRVTVADAESIDAALAAWKVRTEIPTTLVLPGDSELGALLDVARSAVQRAARFLVGAGLADAHPTALGTFNRVSELLYVVARYADANGSAAEG